MMRTIKDLEDMLEKRDERNKQSTEKVDKYLTELKDLWRKNDDLEVDLQWMMIKAGSDELKQKNPKFKEVERKIQNLFQTAEL